MHFGHPNIVFPLVIGKRDNGVGHKPEYNQLKELQSLQQVSRLTTLCPSALPGLPGFVRWGASGLSLLQ
jgi:hypothetical protein